MLDFVEYYLVDECNFYHINGTKKDEMPKGQMNGQNNTQNNGNIGNTHQNNASNGNTNQSTNQSQPQLFIHAFII